MSKRQDDYIYEPQSSSGSASTAEPSPYAVDEVTPTASRLRATSLAVSGFLIAGGIFGAAAMTNAVIETIAPQSAEAETDSEPIEDTENAADGGFFGNVTNFFARAFGGSSAAAESNAEASQNEEPSNASNPAESEQANSDQTTSSPADDSNTTPIDPTSPPPSFGGSDDEDDDEDYEDSDDEDDEDDDSDEDDEDDDSDEDDEDDEDEDDD